MNDSMELTLLRVFLDSSVFIAAAGSKKGSRSASIAVLHCAALGFIRLVTSEKVLDEVDRNIRKKVASDPTKKAILFSYYELMKEIKLEVVPDPPAETFEHWERVTDPNDAPIIEAAVVAQVDYLLSLNTKHFTQTVSELAGIPFLTPGQFMQEARKRFMNWQ